MGIDVLTPDEFDDRYGTGDETTAELSSNMTEYYDGGDDGDDGDEIAELESEYEKLRGAAQTAKSDAWGEAAEKLRKKLKIEKELRLEELSASQTTRRKQLRRDIAELESAAV